MSLNLRGPIYWLKNALRGIRAGLLIQLASTTSIALCLLLVGIAVMGMLNLDRITRFWGRGTQIIVYLKSDAPPARVQALHGLLRSRPEVNAVKLISSQKALARLRNSLGTHGSVLADVEQGFLPASLEVTLRQDQPGRVRALVALLSASSLVDEVDYMGDWARRLNSLVQLVNALALGLSVIVGFACLYIVSSTIRLGVHARREEIEILKLVGATDRFIRAPFMIEGALQGLVGAAMACGLLYLLFRLGAPGAEQLLTSAFSHMELGFLTPEMVAMGIGAGGVLGLLGSSLALGRYMEA